MRRRVAVPVAWLWALSIVLVWTATAAVLRRTILTQQPSRELIAFGAVKGSDLAVSNAWRLLAAQWLHVNVAHMLLNAVVIATVGASVERRTSAGAMVLVGLLGGTAGTWASAVADPGAFVSGASQAYLSLCGAAAILLWRRGSVWWVALAATGVAIGLDVHTSGTIKIGHIAGFTVGIIYGIVTGLRLTTSDS